MKPLVVIYSRRSTAPLSGVITYYPRGPDIRRTSKIYCPYVHFAAAANMSDFPRVAVFYARSYFLAEILPRKERHDKSDAGVELYCVYRHRSRFRTRPPGAPAPQTRLNGKERRGKSDASVEQYCVYRHGLSSARGHLERQRRRLDW